MKPTQLINRGAQRREPGLPFGNRGCQVRVLPGPPTSISKLARLPASGFTRLTTRYEPVEADEVVNMAGEEINAEQQEHPCSLTQGAPRGSPMAGTLPMGFATVQRICHCSSPPRTLRPEFV